MIYCTNCGAKFEGRYCPNCGAPAPDAATSAFGPGVPPPIPPPEVAGVPSNLASLLCYVLPVAGPLLFLLLAPYSRDRKIRFDAWQALFLQLAFFAVNLIVGLFYDVSWRLADFLNVITRLAYFAIVIFMAVKAFQNQRVVLPVVGPLAERQK